MLALAPMALALLSFPSRLLPLPAPAKAGAVPVSRFFLGEGWGCAQARSPMGPTWHCWESPRQEPPASVGVGLRALHIAWMDGFDDFAGGPDRACTAGTAGVACWRRPDSFAPGTAVSPDDFAEERGVAAHYRRGGRRRIDWQPAESGQMPLGSSPGTRGVAVTGGNSTCVRVPDATPAAGDLSNLWCVGDLGPPSWIEGKFVAIAIGTWHACGRTDQGEIRCWGRNLPDALGIEPDIMKCGGLGDPSPCRRRPTPLRFRTSKTEALRAGDLFTCSVSAARAGVSCWGASRDGMFGTRDGCPAGLRAAWPTGRGDVPAPAATCAPRPTPVAGLGRLSIDLAAGPHAGGRSELDFDAGPRGICVVHGRRVRCAGAIPSPQDAPPLAHVRVSPGGDASACALAANRSLRCWGEGYSPAGTSKTVRVAIDPVPRNADDAAIDSSRETGPNCFIHRPCYKKQTLAQCSTAAGEPPAVVWSDVSESPEALEGKQIRVSGLLTVGTTSRTLVGCEGDCCNGAGAALVIRGARNQTAIESMETSLVLVGHGCRGDESRLCCDLVPNQQIVAKGRLERGESWRNKWNLAAPEICVEDAASP